MNSLAWAYQDARRLEEAIGLYEQTLDKRRAKLGPVNPDTLTSMLNLANAYQDAGKLDQSDRLLCDFFQRRRKQDGPLLADPGIPVRLDPSSKLKQRKQRPDTAAVLESLGLNLLKRQQSADAAGMLAGLGLDLLKQQRYAQAEQLLRECVAIRERRLPDSWLQFNALSQLGDKLLGLKQYAQAEPLLLHGYEGMKQREVQLPPPDREAAPGRSGRTDRASLRRDAAAGQGARLACETSPRKSPGEERIGLLHFARNAPSRPEGKR
jgi:tetratricopeptide (TPR) repeat protein